MSNPGDNAVYNSPIAGMLTPSSSRRVSLVLILPILLLAGTAWGQNWAGAEEQLAAEIVAVTGTRTMTVEVENRASSGNPASGNFRSDNPGSDSPGFGSATANDIRRGLLTQLAARGVRLVSAEQAAANVRVSLSGSLQSYVLVAEIQLGTNEKANPPSDKTANNADLAERRIVMVSLPRPATRAVESEAAAMVLHKTLLWAQAEQILDVAVLEGNPAHMLVLDSRSVTFYRQQDGRWQVEQSLAITHSRPWPRDLRGRLEVRKDHVFDAYLPGVLCRSTATSPLAMNCFDGDDAWPIGTNTFNLNANFVSARNYFSGGLLPGGPGPGTGKQMTTAPFYSAAAVPRGESMWWLLASVDGRVHLLDGVTEQVMGKMERGSDIASVRSGCGSGWQVLATGTGEGSRDTVQAFEISDRAPAAASAALEVDGSITALWTDSGEAGAVAVAHHSETGGYEAFRLSVTCGR
jgi:hypothetical protein